MPRTVPPPSGDAFAEVDEQIAFVMDHPDMSGWIKQALGGALLCPPNQVLNDLEILTRILRRRSELMMGDAGGAFGELAAAARGPDARS